MNVSLSRSRTVRDECSIDQADYECLIEEEYKIMTFYLNFTADNLNLEVAPQRSI